MVGRPRHGEAGRGTSATLRPRVPADRRHDAMLTGRGLVLTER